MSSKKLFLLVFLLFNSVIGCASPVPVSSMPPKEETLVPNSTMEPISTPEIIYDCYFTNLTPKENNLCSVEQIEAILRVDVKEPVIKDSQLDFVTAFWNGPSDPDKFNGAGLIYSCPDLEMQMLVWVENDALFSITLNGNSSKELLGKQDLIEIANNAK
jgi:hypothetical protein